MYYDYKQPSPRRAFYTIERDEHFHYRPYDDTHQGISEFSEILRAAYKEYSRDYCKYYKVEAIPTIYQFRDFTKIVLRYFNPALLAPAPAKTPSVAQSLAALQSANSKDDASLLALDILKKNGYEVQVSEGIAHAGRTGIVISITNPK